MRRKNIGQVIFALAVIGLGIETLVLRDFASVWGPVAAAVPGRTALVYLTALLSLACGLGMLWERTVAMAARVLVLALLVWMAAFSVRDVIHAPLAVVSYFGCADTAVTLAAAWVIYARHSQGFLGGETGVRIARVFFGLAMILYGSAHLAYLDSTTVLIPKWIPWHVAMAYFTGCAFLAAAAAVLSGVLARLAATLVTVQIGLFTLLVWVPIVAAGGADAFQRSELVLSTVLTAGSWVVAESYRGRWLGLAWQHPDAARA